MQTTITRMASRTSRKPPSTSRSSLISHTFPAFYACYLLKSIQTPKTQSTYIGSTPNPLRRIRQHNGELVQGASKTKHKRPWVMQMIVHGFPSRLAALQFEWAWQHPHRSRHLRDTTRKTLSRKPTYMKQHIETVQTMICNHPFNLWPLHVKLFTPEAVKIWNDAVVRNTKKDPHTPPFPRAFQCTVELEGVDGRSGSLHGSGRLGPVDVKDEQFTSSFLAKNTAFLASNPSLSCSVCRGPLSEYARDPLSTVLCTAPSCTAISHLLCLSQHFLQMEASESGSANLIPRGGNCPSCNTYTLWGDLIKGCFRRKVGSVVEEPEPDEDEDAMFLSDLDGGEEQQPDKDKHEASVDHRRHWHEVDGIMSMDVDPVVSHSRPQLPQQTPETSSRVQTDGIQKSKKKGTVKASTSIKRIYGKGSTGTARAAAAATTTTGESTAVNSKTKKGRRGAAGSGRGSKVKKKGVLLEDPGTTTSEGEYFDFDVSGSSSDEDLPAIVGQPMKKGKK